MKMLCPRRQNARVGKSVESDGNQWFPDFVDSWHTFAYQNFGRPLGVFRRLETTFKQIRNNYNAIITTEEQCLPVFTKQLVVTLLHHSITGVELLLPWLYSLKCSKALDHLTSHCNPVHSRLDHVYVFLPAQRNCPSGRYSCNVMFFQLCIHSKKKKCYVEQNWAVPHWAKLGCAPVPG